MAKSNVIEMILKLDDKASKKMKKAGQSAKAVAKAAAMMSAAMLAGGAAMGSMLQKMADAQNQLTDMATRTGVASKTLAGLKLAAEGSGQSIESMERMLYGLVNRLQTAKKGSKEAAEGFSDLGIEITDTDGNLRSTDSILREVTTRLAAIDDPTNRAAAAVAALGMQGSRMIQALGDNELQLFVDAAEQFGMNTGPEAAKAAADWQRSMADLSLVTQVFATGGMTLATAAVDNFSAGLVVSKVWLGAYIDVWDDLIASFKTLPAVLGALMPKKDQSWMDWIMMSTPEIEARIAAIEEPARKSGQSIAEIGAEAEKAGMKFLKYQKASRSAAKAMLAGAGAAKEQTEALKGTADAADQAYTLVDRLNSQLKFQAQEAERAAGLLQERIGGIEGTFATIGAVTAPTTAGIGSMIGMAAGGPAGAAIGQGIGEIVAMGDQLDENMESFFGDILGFLKDAPTAILRVISEIIPTFIGELIPALIEMIPKMTVGLVMALGEMLKNLVKAIGNWLNPFKSNKQRAPGDQRGWWERTWDWATGTKPEGFAAGGFVNQTGLSMVHQGERIIPSSGAGTGTATNMAGGGSGVSVTVNGIISPQLIDDLVRELNVALGPRGRGLALDGF